MVRVTDKEGREEVTVTFIKDKQAMYVLRNIEVFSPSHCCSGEVIIPKYLQLLDSGINVSVNE